MPTRDEHLAKAARNEQLASVLEQGTYLDWAATVYFYAALHYMDAVLATHGVDPRNHEDRDDQIGRNQTLKRVYAEYKSLKRMSSNARYYAMNIEPQHIQQIKPDYEALKAYVRSVLKLD